MGELRFPGEKHTFPASGTQSITADADEHINMFALDVSIQDDTTVEITIGSQSIYGADLVATGSPIQLFFYDFGLGRGTGVKGDNLNITMGGAATVYITYAKFSR